MISADDLGYTDPDDNDAGVTFTVTEQSNGKIQVAGIDETPFTGTQLAAGAVTFLHDGSETTAASFKVSVEDGNEDASTPTQSTFHLTVDRGERCAGRVRTRRCRSARARLTRSWRPTLVSAMSIDSPANALAAVKISSLPLAGTLRYNGAAITATQVSNGFEVSAADIASGLLSFQPALGVNGAGYASFTFQVRDNGGTGNGGVDLDPTANTITIDVGQVNNAPAGGRQDGFGQRGRNVCVGGVRLRLQRSERYPVGRAGGGEDQLAAACGHAASTTARRSPRRRSATASRCRRRISWPAS